MGDLTRTALYAPLSLIALAAAPASAQMKPASADDVLGAIAACRSITTPVWIDTDALEEQGWYTAEVRGERRRTRKVRGIYERRNNRAYVVTTRDELRSRECAVQARLESTSDYVPLLQQVSQTLGMPTGQDGFAYTWELDGLAMRVEPTGDRSAPSARFVLTALPVVGTDDILSAVRACIPAIGAGGFGDGALTEGGWAQDAAATAAVPEERETKLFRSGETAALVSSGKDRGVTNVCRVSGRIEDEATAENLRSALTGLYGTPSAKGDDLNWTHDGRSMRLVTSERDGASGPIAFHIPVSYVGESE